MRVRDVIKATLSRPVAFHAILAKICGSATAGLMLSQAIYWSERTTEPEGWFFKSQAEWEDEICLTRYEQETARKILRQKGFLEDVRRGNPARLFYRVNQDAVARAVAEYAEKHHGRSTNTHIPEEPQSRLRENHNQDCGIPADKPAGKPQSKTAGKPHSLKGPETTAETTAEIFGTAGAVPFSSSSKKNEDREADPRFQPVVDAVHKCWPEGVPFDFGPDDGAALNRMLLRRRKWTADELAECVVFRFLSENINPAESVKAWIGALTDYASGPQDKYGSPRGDAEYWRKHARVILYGKQPEQQKLPQPAGDPIPPLLDSEGGKKAWTALLDALAGKISRSSFDTWLKPLRALGAKDRVLYVQVPTPEFKHVAEKYGNEISTAIRALGLAVDDIRLICKVAA